MDAQAFLDDYFAQYRDLLINAEVEKRIQEFATLAKGIRAAKRKMMFAGNGASASIAEHGAVDFTKQGKVRAVTFHDPNLMTCFANDFGYDHWVAKAIEHYGDEGDAVVLISTSGQSPSVVNAAHKARDMGMQVISFTGRTEDNALKAASDLSFWVPSHAYNVVENLHSIWLTATIDFVIGKAEYETRDLVG
ncbi:phosphoheptose isomerase [Sulfitobacter sp. SK012]|uniref:D-sedoheptulose-7-phosphate isomerase n=1 Tax=Sulfitobacter sp. SK012 TaxID=1389005 RepID=UPI000E0AC98C|nr:SIS domain-containing protein [Sulfitobacter sp. SK012]AXI48001.1 phosphoheptose isomerase [Sulfitobacter sp. SK012]